MTRYLAILSFALALSLSATALPQGTQKQVTAKEKGNADGLAVNQAHPAARYAVRQIHNADYGSGSGPSGNPGSPAPAPTNTETEPSTPTQQADATKNVARSNELIRVAPNNKASKKHKRTSVQIFSRSISYAPEPTAPKN